MKKLFKKIYDTFGDPMFTVLLRTILIRTLVDALYLFLLFLILTNVDFSGKITFVLIGQILGSAFLIKMFFVSAK